MVHRKSTYQLMFKNYAANTRRNVWQENSTLRERRREEERTHQPIQESDDSECDCDEDLDDPCDEYQHNYFNEETLPKSQHYDKIDSNIAHSVSPFKEKKQLDKPPSIPRLRFTPDHSPRRSSSNEMDESHNLAQESTLNFEDNVNKVSFKIPSISESETGYTGLTKNTQSEHKLKEYDLIPATLMKQDTRHVSKKIPNKCKGIIRSKQYPITTKLSKTTMRNYCRKDKSPPYVPFGTSGSVRNIGDKTSYNVHLNNKQVHKTALNAMEKRQDEIDNLVQKQRRMSLNDWRKKTSMPDNINHSSLFCSARHQLFSKTSQPRLRTFSAPSRVHTLSSYCNHCGGRK